MKYFIFSIDDGTVFDKQVLDIFNKYGIKATFNINSGLASYIWFNEGIPIERHDLNFDKYLYEGHEIASHSLTHPHLTMCPGEVISKEVGEDVLNLEKITGKPITTFAFPFSDWDERCIEIIKHIHNLKVIRLSDIDTSFKFPKDLHHVKITSLEIYDALVLVDQFIKDKEAQLFVFVSHGYDFYMNHSYEQLELLCQKVTKRKDIEIITMSELTKIKLD